MRYLAVGLLLLAAGPVMAADSKELLKYVFVTEIEEHRVIVSAPLGLTDTDKGAELLDNFAEDVCQLYRRRAVGLSVTSGGGKACGVHQLLAAGQRRDMTAEEQAQCPELHLYACALR